MQIYGSGGVAGHGPQPVAFDDWRRCKKALQVDTQNREPIVHHIPLLMLVA